MAKVSAHGATLATIEKAAYSIRYMSDGIVLKNYGQGWKIHGKCKDGLSPVEVAKTAIERQRADIEKRPAFAAYRNELFSLASMATRARLHMTVQLMPDDCDGVWSECCDGYGDNVHADVDEVGHLCNLYKLAVTEKSSQKET